MEELQRLANEFSNYRSDGKVMGNNRHRLFGGMVLLDIEAVSYTHLTLPTNREV